MSRQQMRANRRRVLWLQMSGENALRDEHGIIPRRVRRDMSGFRPRRKIKRRKDARHRN